MLATACETIYHSLMSEIDGGVAGESIFSGVDLMVQQRLGELGVAQGDLAGLNRQRDAAMKIAAEPFDSPISEASGVVRRIESEISSEKIEALIRDLPIDETEATAFTMLLGSTGVAGLAQSYLQAARGDDRSRRTYEYHKRPLDNFAAFYRTLVSSGEPLPVMYMHMEWQEQFDIQAQHEGRSSGMGTFEKQCSLLRGSVTASDLTCERPETEDFSLLPTLPSALLLRFPKLSTQLTSEQEWGAVESRLKQTDRPEDVVLTRTQGEYDNYRGRVVSWSGSGALDISLLEENPISRRKRRTDGLRTLVYGEQIGGVIEALKQDEYVPGSTKRLLGKF